MYLPRHFEETDLSALHAFLRAYDFALLALEGEDGPEAVHLPVLFDAERGPHGTLSAHVARANPIWRRFDGARQALVVFHGPHAYVSPTWYAEAGSVPTWNYAAVHVLGAPKIVADRAGVVAILERLVAANERGPAPWRMADWADLVDTMLPGIVAFELPVARIEGKWKLSQNKTAADRAGVVAALASSDDPGSRATAALMAARERG